MRPRSKAGLILLAAAVAACGMAFTPDDTSLFSKQPQSIRGAWKSTTYQQVIGTPCPWIIEFFDDGSVETNYINDDKGKLCLFARLAYEQEPEHDPPLLHIAGQLSHCLHRLQEGRLQLACDDRSVPSAEKTRWIEFEPLEVQRGRRLKDLQGTWLPPLFWGGKERMVIAPDGKVAFGKDSGSVKISGKYRLVLKGRGREEKCLFRVTKHRLTLRCRPEPTDWPETLFDPDVDPADLETLVFYRQPD